MEIDLNNIKNLGEIREEENFIFRSFLKGQDPDKIDRKVNELNEKYFELIDCKECGNCCNNLQPLIKKDDLERLKNELGIKEDQIINELLEKDEDGDLRLKGLPCRFLEDKKCKIYKNRPDDCKSFPHLHKKRINSRLFGVIDNYSICPIVFNVYEELKIKLI